MTQNRLTKLFIKGKLRPVRLILRLMLLLIPVRIVLPVANAFGNGIRPGLRIGFFWITSDRLVMAPGAQVGHFNLVHVRRLVLRNEARLGHLNGCRGFLSLRLDESAVIGNRNVIVRALRGTVFGPAEFCLGNLAKITAGHFLDCTQTIRLGYYSTLAGKSSQICTRGSVHEPEAPKRFRIDGKVLVGNNVNLGSGVIVTSGVRICDNANVVVGTCVRKELAEPGFYVSGKLRMLPKPADPNSRTNLERVDDPELLERVYRKRDARS